VFADGKGDGVERVDGRASYKRKTPIVWTFGASRAAALRIAEHRTRSGMPSWLLLTGLLHDLAGLKTTRAYPDFAWLAVDPGVHGLEINIVAPETQVVRFAYRMADTGLLSAYFANLRHHLLQIIAPIYGLLSRWQADLFWNCHC